MELSRRAFLARTGAAGLTTWAGAAHGAAPAPRPNIILILADDLGWGELGCYGQEQILTPVLDRFAAEGIRYTQAYAGSCVCAPSRCCLMTGLHNGHGRVRDNIPHGVFLQPDDRTVAEVLKQAGYRTGAIGKWSLGNPGSWGVANYQGFDYFYGHLDQDQAHYYYPDYLWENNKVVELRGNRGGKRGDYTGDLFTQKALDFVDDNHQNPFFLYLAYTWPHWSDYDKSTPDSLPIPSDAPYTDRDWPQVEKNHAAMVTRMDSDIGRLAERVRELGLAENTLFLFTSDNGPSGEASHSVDFFRSAGPYRGKKRDLYEGGIRVPFVGYWPGIIPAGTVSDTPLPAWDVLPTLAELAGLPPPAGVDGISRAQELRGAVQDPAHEYLYWDYGHIRGTFSQAVLEGNLKGIRNGPETPLEVYDLSRDPGETQNIAGERPADAARLESLFTAAYVPSADYPIAPASAASP